MASDFDAKAPTWDDDPAKVERARRAAEAIGDAVPLSASTRLLEYGAGTGLVSQTLSDDVGTLTLAEPSAGMRAVIDEKVATGSLPADTRVWDLDLSAGPVPDERFDIAVSVMTLHHIHDLGTVLAGFASLLAGGGHLCIVDLEAEDGSFHSEESGFDGHHGFDREALTEWLETAGFVDVRLQHCYQIEKDQGTYPLFLAVCRTVAD